MNDNNNYAKCPSYFLEYFYDENKNIKCSNYKEPFFLSNNNTIEACSDYIDISLKCSYLNLDKKS